MESFWLSIFGFLVAFHLLWMGASQSTNKLDGLQLCLANCASGDRLTGSTRMRHTRDHPYKVARFPTVQMGFCQLGCQIFFSEGPKNTTCKNNCNYYYRIKTTTGYSDVIEEAKLECRDGCDIGLQVCQAGYYCTDGEMTLCPPGKFREAVKSLAFTALEETHQCIDCPSGRYRGATKGKSANDCSLCPIGKYVNTTGSVYSYQCERCPAGKTAAEEGSSVCVCITPGSCDLPIQLQGFDKQEFFKNDVDYFRETVPFIGRW